MLTNVHIVKAMVFVVVIYRYESWTIKKSEYQRIETFKLWCWRRPLRIPWTARRSNQSILKEINPEYSSEGLSLRLKLQYFDHLMQRTNSLEKALMLGRIEGKRRRGWQRMRRLDSITGWTDMNLSKVWEIVEDREAWPATIHGVEKSWTCLSSWTTTIFHCMIILYFIRPSPDDRRLGCFYLKIFFFKLKYGRFASVFWRLWIML